MKAAPGIARLFLLNSQAASLAVVKANFAWVLIYCTEDMFSLIAYLQQMIVP